MNTYSFTKEERLKRKKWIQLLFSKGKTLQLSFVRLYYLPYYIQKQNKHQVLFCVPKKKLNKAVARNKIKRRLREAYRLSKHQIQNIHPQVRFLIGYVYTGKNIEKATYTALLTDVQHTLAYLKQWIHKGKKKKIITL